MPTAEEGAQIAEEFLKDLRAGLKTRYKRKREGIHVSDMCPRQIVYRDMNDLDLTNQEVNFFTSGSAIGAAVQALTEEHGKKYSSESFTSIGHFINGHIDIYNKEKNIPIEFKSYRSGSTNKLPKSHNLDQIMQYMTGQNSPVGLLVYQLLMKFGNDQSVRISLQPHKWLRNQMLKVEADPFVLYVIWMDDDERKAFADKKIERGLLHVKARALGQPALAPHVWNDPELNWICKECPFRVPCKQLIDEEAKLVSE